MLLRILRIILVVLVGTFRVILMMYIVNKKMVDMEFSTFLITHAFQDPDTKDLRCLRSFFTYVVS